VVVPEAARAVDRWRLLHTYDGALGVPAHVTVLYPFVPPASLEADLTALVAELAASQAPFDVSFRRVARWPDGIVYLPPEPPEPFLALIAGACARWPEWPPYGGAHDEVVPHLTVVDDEAVADEAARDVESSLPLAARIDELTLLAEGADGRWRVHAAFPLGVRRPE